MDSLISLISNLISPSTDEASRKDLQQQIFDSFSGALIQTFLEIIKTKEVTDQIRIPSIVILSSIFKNINNFPPIPNLSSYLLQIYSTTLELILTSDSSQLSHSLSILLSSTLITLISLNEEESFPISFFKDLFTGLSQSTNSFSFHGFCNAIIELLTEVSISDYCSEIEISEFLNLLILISQHTFQIYSENVNSKSLVNEEITKRSIDTLSLCQNFFEQEDLTDFFNETGQSVSLLLIQNILPFLTFLDTFPSTMDVLASIFDSDLHFPLEESIPQLIENSIAFLDSNFSNQSNEIIRKSFLSFLSLLNNISKSCFNYLINPNFTNIIAFLFKIMSNSPPNCDLKSDWEPHIAAQICLSSIFDAISNCLTEEESTVDESIDFLALINEIATITAPQLQSTNFSERAAALQLFQLLIFYFGNSYFIPIKTTVLELLSDPCPRVRNASIMCLTEFVKSIQDHRCINQEQYGILNEIYQASKIHINENNFIVNADYGNEDDILLISLSTFSLFHSVALISGFEHLQELGSLIFLNLPFFGNKHINKLIHIIKKAHFCIIYAYPTLEQLFLSSFQLFQPQNNVESVEELISILIDLEYEYVDRFGDKLPISPEFMEAVVQFTISNMSTVSTYTLPLLGLILSKFPDFAASIEPISLFCFQIFQAFNSESSFLPLNNSILFFKVLIELKLLPNEILQEIFAFLFPFIIQDFEIEIPIDLLTNSINVILLIFQQIPEITSPDIFNNFISILQPYQILQFRANNIKKIFVTTISNIEMAFSLFPVQLFDGPIASNCLTYIITLQKQSSHQLQKVMKIMLHISENYPELFLRTINDENNFEEFVEFLQMCPNDSITLQNIFQIKKNLGLDKK